MQNEPSASFMDPHQPAPNQYVCALCHGPKMISESTMFGVCPRCDQDATNGIVWPNDYIEWHPGMQYPGQR